jgi:uncharacterized membrane protein
MRSIGSFRIANLIKQTYWLTVRVVDWIVELHFGDVFLLALVKSCTRVPEDVVLVTQTHLDGRVLLRSFLPAFSFDE